MFENRSSDKDLLRRVTQEDLTAKTVRMALSAVPCGGIVAEFLTEFIPRQRLDRLQEYVELLEARLGGLQEAFQARLHESAAYAALTEQTTLAAVRTASSQRRRDFAELLRT